MGAPLLAIILASASVGGGLDGAQTAYMRCLDSELGVAVSQRVDGARFADGAARICAEETATYRRMAVAAMVGQGAAGGSPDAAAKKFDAYDRTSRAELVSTFEQRMKLRRGPARVTGLASGLVSDRRIQRD